MLLEICANSYQSAINAENAGAPRIELCTELNVGGLTPNHDVLKQVLDTLRIPVFVLIRPRDGDFVYTKAEFNRMKTDIELCKKLGCHGIVSGVIKPDTSIDFERTKELVELSKPLPFTFHRAFDLVQNPLIAIQQLIQLGISRVLTSGQEKTAVIGIELLIQLQKKTSNKIIILPGSGINATNALLFKNAGFSEIHSSASKIVQNSTVKNDEQLFFTYSSTTNIKAILKSINDEK